MKDYWNDPPEEPEPPFCNKCGEYMDIAESWLTAKCPVCGKEWAAPPQEIFEPEPLDQEPIDDN